MTNTQKIVIGVVLTWGGWVSNAVVEQGKSVSVNTALLQQVSITLIGIEKELGNNQTGVARIEGMLR